jgi:hypothetical protein
MGDSSSGASEYWRSLRGEFDELAKEDLPSTYRRGCLHATVSFEHDSVIGNWSVSGPSEDLTERFKTFVSRAGAALNPPKNTTSLDYWLRCLYLDLLKHKSKQLWGARADRGDGIIEALCNASATYCTRLERKAIERERVLPHVETNASEHDLTCSKSKASEGAIGRPRRFPNDFVGFAGKLWVDTKRVSGKVTIEQLQTIADSLDKKGYVPPADVPFHLREVLTPDVGNDDV